MELGINRLVGQNEDRICEAVFELVSKENSFEFDPSLYGDGKASERIVEVIGGI